MKPRTVVVAALAVSLASAVAQVAVPCTSFAVYSDRTLYGANFDYTPSAVRFLIEEDEVGAIFLGAFRMGGAYVTTTGLNERGLFAVTQMVYPARAVVDHPERDEVYIWDAFRAGLGACAAVDDVSSWIGDRRLVQYDLPQLHTLYADPAGGAMIVECNDRQNVVTGIEGRFIVMTNFHVGDFVGKPLDEIVGSGADRYRMAYAYIEEHLGAFDFDHAFEVLRRASMSTGTVQTRHSLVLDPETLEIYIALERDYDHIWKVSLTERTIAAFRGFEKGPVLPLGPAGIDGATLIGYARTQEPEPEKPALEPPAETEVTAAAGPVPREGSNLHWTISVLIVALLAVGAVLLLDSE